MIRTCFNVSLVLSACLILSGCQSAGGGGGGQGNDNTPDAGNGNANDNTSGSTLSEVEQAAADAAVVAMEELASALASTFPIMNRDDLVSGEITCPAITVAVNEAVLDVILDYGIGCSPAVYPEATISGSVTGEFNPDVGTVELTFDDLSGGTNSIDGTLTGSLVSDNTTQTAASLSLNLTFDDGSALAGTVAFEFDLLSGLITITDGSLSYTDSSGNGYDLTLDDVVIDPAGNGNFVPESGTVTLVIPNPEPIGPATITVEVTFTAQTPVDGTVQVSVGGAAPVTYTPAP